MSEEQQPSEINVEMQSPQQDVNVEEGDKINENITDIERNAGDQINVDRGDNVLEAGDIEQNVNFESPQVPDITEQNVSPHIEQTLSQQIDSPLPDMEEDLEESIPDVQQPTETFIPPSPEEELNVPTEFELPTIPSQETTVQHRHRQQVTLLLKDRKQKYQKSMYHEKALNHSQYPWSNLNRMYNSYLFKIMNKMAKN